MAEIFLYVGTILIAFEIIREVSHLPTLIIILWWKFFRCTFGNVDKLIKNCPMKVIRITLRVVLRILASPIVVLAITTAIAIVVIWLAGTILVMINNLVNGVYRMELKNMQKEKEQAKLIGKVFRFFVPKVENEIIGQAIDKIYIRFVAIIGIILITVGFVYKLVIN